LNERDVQERLVVLQHLQSEAEAVQRKIVELEIIDSQLEKTIESLEFFNSLDGNVEALMNLGGGVFAYVDVKNAKKMLVDVGAGVVVEKEVGDAIEFLKKKRDAIQQDVTKLEGLLNQIIERARVIQQELAEIEKGDKEDR
jgi:prefoldin alpha subunit